MDGRNFDELTRKLANGASRRSLLKGLIGGGAAIVATKASGGLAAPAAKVTLCHATSSDSNPWVMITVSENSKDLPAHYSHGDFPIAASNGEEGSTCCRDQDCKCAGQCVKAVCDNFANPGGGTCACEPTPGAACEDGEFCTVNDVCGEEIGQCLSGDDRDCSALTDQCNTGTCNESTDSCEAVPTNEGLACDDELTCNVGETCQSGECTGGGPKDCSAVEDQCNDSACSEEVDGGCYAVPINEGLACEDGLTCNIGETCQSGECTGGGPEDCSNYDDGLCTVGACAEPGGCYADTTSLNGTACDDGDLCTTSTTCSGGTCGGGTTVTCPPAAVCKVQGACDPDSGCPAPTNAPSGSGCPGGTCDGSGNCEANIYCRSAADCPLDADANSDCCCAWTTPQGIYHQNCRAEDGCTNTGINGTCLA